MDADNDDRPHYHFGTEHSDNHDPVRFVYDLDFSCTNDRCSTDIVYILTPDEYRALVAAARDRHPAGQQRGPDPATRADNCICWGYGDDHHAACPACTP